MTTKRLCRLALLLPFLIASYAGADPGHPVAVRWWGQGLTTIETWWNLRIAIDPYALRIGYDDPGLEADVVLITHEHFDHNNPALVGGDPTVVRGLDDQGNVRDVTVVLDRAPDAPEPSLTTAGRGQTPSRHAVRISTVPAFHDDESGTKRGRTAMFLIEVDGVRILHAGDLGQSSLSAEQLEAIGTVDVFLVPVGGVYTVDGETAATIAAKLNPHFVIPIHYKTDALTLALEGVDPFLEALPERFAVNRVDGNTLAVSEADELASYQPTAVVLSYEPWEMPDELAQLFQAKEQAARDSRAVFEGLSVEQMNHRPSDGTHTPRWNAEHVMGRELGFFSSVYHRRDPSIAEMDLNPMQMPEDYEAAHADWSGVEEARQIKRVTDFTRRFAYLLAGQDLDAPLEGSPWTLRGLLEQMARHYAEHTANVKKKFELPDWPGER